MTRRTFLSGAALAAAATTGGCGRGWLRSTQAAADANTLTFTTWASDAELVGFKQIVAGFEKANPGYTVLLNAVPYEQIFQTIDAQLQSGTAPDVFRVQYYNFGAYAGRGQLLDLSGHLPDPGGTRFTDAGWAAIQHQGRPYGVPHHTDTTAIYYNKDAFASAGITSVPASPRDAWTWDEFGAVAQKLRGALPDRKYPFVYNWQKLGVTRWLSWLFEADGSFLAHDLRTPSIDSSAGRSAVDFTRSFFPKKWVPPNSSIKTSTYAEDIFFAETTAFAFGGAFEVPDAVSTVKFDWGVTFAPRGVRQASDLGGNALVATAGTKKADLAGRFLDYATQQEPMRRFCARASLLPTLRTLVEQGIRFDVRPDLSPVFVDQAATVRAADAAQVASPSMSKIIPVLQDQLEAAFVGGQSTERTVRNMTSGIAKATAP